MSPKLCSRGCQRKRLARWLAGIVSAVGLASAGPAAALDFGSTLVITPDSISQLVGGSVVLLFPAPVDFVTGDVVTIDELAGACV